MSYILPFPAFIRSAKLVDRSPNGVSLRWREDLLPSLSGFYLFYPAMQDAYIVYGINPNEDTVCTFERLSFSLFEAARAIFQLSGGCYR
jgi:hypothetical protein